MRPAKIRGGIHCESMDSGQTIPVQALWYNRHSIDTTQETQQKQQQLTIKTGVLPYS